ncbi:MAG: HEAT repeat domain-containing protein [Spirochaetia bacterium]
MEKVTFDQLEKWKAEGNQEKIIQALHYPEHEIRFGAVFLLGDIGDKQAVEALHEFIEENVENKEDINTYAKQSIEIIKERLENPEASIITEQMISEWVTQKNTNKLISALYIEDSYIVIKAVEGLGELKPPEAVVPLSELIYSHSNFLVSDAAVKALSQIGTEAVLDPLISALEHKESIVRTTALKCLSECMDVNSIDKMLLYLDSKDNKLKKSAIEIISRMGTDAIHPLLTRLGSEDKAVRSAAIAALVKIGKSVVPRMQDCMRSRDNTTKISAIKVLGKVKSLNSLDLLIQALDDEDTEVCQAAAEALALFGEPAVEKLNEKLICPRTTTRLFAVRSLGRIKSDKALIPLTQLFTEDDEKLRKEAVQAVSQIGKPAVEHLSELVKESSAQVQCCAIEAMGIIGDKGTTDILGNILLSDNNKLHSVAAIGLSNKGNKGITRLVEAMENDDPSISEAASNAMDRVLKPLFDQLRHENGYKRSEAAQKLGRIGAKNSVDVLVPLLEDPFFIARNTAKKALDLLGYWKAPAQSIKQDTEFYKANENPMTIELLIDLLEEKDIVKFDLLFKQGLNINITGPDGFNLLMYSLDDGNTKMAEYFVDAGIDLSHTEKRGMNALVIALKNGNTRIAKKLIENKINIHQRDQTGSTPLFYAIYQQKQEIIQMLLEDGAETELQNSDGLSPRAYAEQIGNNEVLDLFKRHSKKWWQRWK